MMKKLAAMIAVLACALAGLSVASPAQAAASDCSNYPGTFCLFQFTNWGGRVWRQYPWQVEGCRSFVPDDFNDRTTAMWNNTNGSHLLRAWQHANCTGWYYDLPSGTVVDFSSTPSYDNNVSAIEDIEF